MFLQKTTTLFSSAQELLHYHNFCMNYFMCAKCWGFFAAMCMLLGQWSLCFTNMSNLQHQLGLVSLLTGTHLSFSQLLMSLLQIPLFLSPPSPKICHCFQNINLLLILEIYIVLLQ